MISFAMTAENSLGDKNEALEAHLKKQGEYIYKMIVAGGVTISFGVLSLVFPPALGGAVLGVLETGRQGLKGKLEDIKFHSKDSF